MTPPETKLPTELINYSSDHLGYQLNQMPEVGQWQFGPFNLMARQSGNLVVVDWLSISDQPNSFGEFYHKGKRWVFAEKNSPSGSVPSGESVRELSFTQVNPQAGDPTKYVIWTIYSYSVKSDSSFNFSAQLPDALGGFIDLTSPLQPGASTSILVSKHWPDSIYHQLSGQKDSSLPILSGITVKDIVNLLSAGSGAPDILGLLNLDDLQPLIDLNRECGLNPIGDLSSQLLKISSRQGITQLPRRYLRNQSIANSLNLAPIPIPSNSGIAVALVELIHDQPNWLVSGNNMALENIQVVVGQRAANKNMAGKLAVVSGGINLEEKTLGLKGAVLTALREVDEEQEISSPVVLSYSTPIITGSYLDIIADPKRPFWVITCTRLIADPTASVGFSWATQGKMEFSGPPILVCLADLQDQKTLNQFHPGVLMAIGQSLRAVSRLNPNKLRGLTIGRLNDTHLRQFNLNF